MTSYSVAFSDVMKAPARSIPWLPLPLIPNLAPLTVDRSLHPKGHKVFRGRPAITSRALAPMDYLSFPLYPTFLVLHHNIGVPLATVKGDIFHSARPPFFSLAG